MVKPFLKWVGGKTQIIDQVIQEFPDDIENYWEPFLGGGSVLLQALASNKIKGQVFASDINKDLIELYLTIQNNCEQFIKDVHTLEEKYNLAENKEDYYYSMRMDFNKQRDSVKFIFLNKTCFRGVYREGPKGFNVPFGHYKNVNIIDDENIRLVSKLIKKVHFSHASFEYISPSKGDFVYLDPPYAPINVTSFVGYTAKGFTEHQKLFDFCKSFPCKWLMSNASVPLVRETFAGHPTKVISCRRAINSKNPESRADEVLVKNL